MLKYAAGLFDGDGCVVVTRYVYKSKSTVYYYVVACITNQHLPVLCKFKKRWKGHIRIHKLVNPVYVWVVKGVRAEKFLKDICPYAIIKKDQVLTAIEYRNLGVTRHKFGVQFMGKLQELKKVQFESTREVSGYENIIG